MLEASREVTSIVKLKPPSYASLVKPASVLHAGIVVFLFVAGAPAWAAAAATTTTLAVTSGTSAVTTVSSVSVVTLTATVKAGTTPVTAGQVLFCNAAAEFCTDIHVIGVAQLTKAGTAIFKFRPGIGIHSYKAAFVGTKADKGSASAAKELTVTGIYPTSTSFSPSGVVGDYTLMATVGGNGPAPPTGTVSFVDASDGNALLENAPLSPAGLGFFTSWSPSGGQGSVAISVGDFNGDGIPDLAVIDPGLGSPSAKGVVEVLLGNGDGTFTATAASLATGPDPDFIVTADFNGDGVLDLAIATFNEHLVNDDNKMTVLLGKGDGTFTDAAASPSVPNGPISVVVGDFNLDGIPDLAFVNDSDTVTVVLGNGDGTFSAASTVPLSYPPLSIASGDFNGDGIQDLAVLVNNSAPKLSSGAVVVLLGKGDGTFSLGETSEVATAAQPETMTVGDFNGDGIPDLAVVNYKGTVTVMLGDGKGAFNALSASPVTGLDPTSIAIGDFNGDGIPDLVVANDAYQGLPAGKGTVTVLLGKGDGTFAPATSPSAGLYPLSIAVGDFNGDGFSDMAVANGAPGFLATALLTENQTATATATGVSVPTASGPQDLGASYAGDSNYKPSRSGSISVTAPAVLVSLASSSAAVAIGSPVTFTATLKGYGSGVAPTGKMSFASGKLLWGTATLNGSGVASLTTSSIPPACHGIVATYEGDGNYAPATSGIVYLWVAGKGETAQPTFTLTPSATLIASRTSVTFTAKLALQCHPSAGTVTYFDGTTVLGTAPLGSGGISTFSTSALPVGTDSITASKSAGTNYAAATTAPVIVTVNSN